MIFNFILNMFTKICARSLKVEFRVNFWRLISVYCFSNRLILNWIHNITLWLLCVTLDIRHSIPGVPQGPHLSPFTIFFEFVNDIVRLLLFILNDLKFSGSRSLLEHISACLKNRLIFFVMLQYHNVTAGVPQRSHLGPLLFLKFVDFIK